MRHLKKYNEAIDQLWKMSDAYDVLSQIYDIADVVIFDSGGIKIINKLMKHLKPFNENNAIEYKDDIEQIVNIIGDDYPTTFEEENNNTIRVCVKRCNGSVEDKGDDITTYGTENEFINSLDQVVRRLQENYNFKVVLGMSVHVPGKQSKHGGKDCRHLKLEEWSFQPNNDPLLLKSDFVAVSEPSVDRDDWTDYKQSEYLTEMRIVFIKIRSRNEF